MPIQDLLVERAPTAVEVGENNAKAVAARQAEAPFNLLSYNSELVAVVCCVFQEMQCKHTMTNAPPRNIPACCTGPYDAVGSTASITCEPAELHFQGFTPGQPLRQAVRIRNDAPAQTRVMVVPPSCSNFKVIMCVMKAMERNSGQQHYHNQIHSWQLSFPPCCC